MRFVKKLLSYFRKAEAGSKPQGHETEAASEPQTHDVCGNCYYYQPAEYLGVEPPSPLREWPSDSGLCNKGQRKPFVVHVGQHLHIVRKTDDACDDFEKGSSGLVVVKDTPDEALHDAASAGDTATLRRLIAEGVDVNAEAFNGETP